MSRQAKVSAPAFDTHRVIEGQGPCVVLIHGVGLDHEMWSLQAKALGKSFTVLRYDLIGHGGTPPWPGGFELEDLVAQLAALLDEQRVNQAHVVGFSLGALIAQAFALAHSHRLLGIVLVSGVYDRDRAARESVLKRLQQAERDGPPSVADAALERWFTKAYRKAHSDEVHKIERRLRANNADGFLPAYRLFAHADEWLADRLNEIRAPALVITGEDDVGSTPDMARRMSQAMRNAECRIVPSVRHMLPLEAAQELNTMLNDFLIRPEQAR